ncbi:MAG: glutathione S-transferase [Pseudomonadota bacterium]
MTTTSHISSQRLASELPVLYSFRRCPYAIRARMAIVSCGLQVALREVELKNKPNGMLAASPKGTVPVLVLNAETVIDESLDVMYWALKVSKDPCKWLAYNQAQREVAQTLVTANDKEFKVWLDKYKYFERFPESPRDFYRQKAEVFLLQLEERLASQSFLIGDTQTFVDVAIFPFIRQFVFADPQWFVTAHYPQLKRWLDFHLSSSTFERAMVKLPPYLKSQASEIFPMI